MGKEFKDAVKTRPGYPGNYARKPDAAPIEGVYSGPKMAEAQKIRENEDELIAAVYAGPGMMGGDFQDFTPVGEKKEGAESSEKALFCPECGAKVKKGAQFCPCCGKRFTAQAGGETDPAMNDVYGGPQMTSCVYAGPEMMKKKQPGALPKLFGKKK